VKQNHRKLLILDLDETLIHASEEAPAVGESFRLGPYHACERPHVGEFLRQVEERFELAVWSSASGPYVAQVVERLFERPEELRFVWSRERCTQRFCPETSEHYWRKHLKKVKRFGYDLSQVIVVDDSPEKWEQSYGNLVTVRPFTGEVEDVELLLLGRYLETLAGVEDVRRVEKRGWRRLVRE
jgi:TFIIF-interacting CTD phosphatase-like protein